ncbi:desmin [Nematolebias whitei]|uniref:desmin n=1 Tax=Nematolebias whitei TaxID=451745 RepID=UPI001896FBC2|nr:desmin [Nematolebias whitei]
MGDTADFSLMDPINEEFLNKRSDEKAQMQLLNNRFAAYIENIRSLKKQNHKLTLEVESLRSYTSTSLTEMRTEEMSKLNKEKDSLTSEVTSLKVERDRLKTSLDQETRLKLEAEKACDDLKVELEAEKQKLKNETDELQRQIKLNKKVHKQELTELKTTVLKGVSTDQTDMTKSELTAELENIRKQYEGIAAENIAKAEKLYNNQITEMDKTVSTNKEELSMANKKITELNVHINELTSTITSLNTTINDMKDHQRQEKEKLESKIAKMKVEMANQLCNYQKLLCVKMELDMEISCYRKLLEEEEVRIGVSKQDNSAPSKTDLNQGKGQLEIHVSSIEQSSETKSSIQTIINDNVTRTSSKGELNSTRSNSDINQGDGHAGMTPAPTSEKSSDTKTNIIKTATTEITTTSTKGDLNFTRSNSAVSQGEGHPGVTPAPTSETKSPPKEKPSGSSKTEDQKSTPKNPDPSPKSSSAVFKNLKGLMKKQ